MADKTPIYAEFDSNGNVSSLNEFSASAGDTVSPVLLRQSISSLDDVSSTLNPSVGDNLVWNGSTWTASADAGGGGGSESLSGLTDTNIVSPSTNQVLQWDGSEWINATNPAGVTALSGMSDVTFTDVDTHQHLQWDGSQWVNAYEDEQYFQIRNQTGSTLTKGQAVFVSGSHTEDTVLVGLAQADSSATMPSIGIVSENTPNNENGLAVTFGKAKGIALPAATYTEGDTVYVSPSTPGAITNTKPTADNHLIQNIGIVTRTNNTNGAIKVTGVGRANDIPNAVTLTDASSVEYLYVKDGDRFNKVTRPTLASGLHHGDLSGLGDDDHPQYVLSATNNQLSSDVSNHIASASVHFTEASIDHTAISNIGSNSHSTIDTKITELDNHVASASVHFTEASIDHTAISNIGSNSHSTIDTKITELDNHVASATVHFLATEVSLSGLSDTSSNISPTTGDNLVWNGTNWSASSESELAETATHPSAIDYIYGDDGGTFKKIEPSALNSFLWIRSAADGTAVTEQYFGSGTGTLTANESGFPNASSTMFTNGYVEIPYDGIYEIYAKIGMNVVNSPTTCTIAIMETTGFGGTETTLALATNVLRTNIDPHQTVCDYIGALTAGTKIAIKLTANSTFTIKPERYASVSFKKIG